jgi:hypothetical protein
VLNLYVPLLSALTLVPSIPPCCELPRRAEVPTVLVGIVTVAVTGSPLAGAEVQDIVSGMLAVTNGEGVFRLAGLEPGVVTVEVRSPGLEPLLVQLELRRGQTVRIRAGQLGLRGWLDEFYRREARGSGTFIERRDVERWRPQNVTDLLRRVRGVRVSRARTGRTAVDLTRARSHCPPVVFIDHQPVGDTSTFDLDAMMKPSAIEAVEVYGGISTVPAEFDVIGAHCGALVFWTKH